MGLEPEQPDADVAELGIRQPGDQLLQTVCRAVDIGQAGLEMRAEMAAVAIEQMQYHHDGAGVESVAHDVAEELSVGVAPDVGGPETGLVPDRDDVRV
ncbi:hypothetical protein KDL01_09375 [Actinospica durhamensis]|uniref:Uncharacterized protein n=1 Tax=Actinospica durhamensis TaxID=1508375 RepID=A0A941ILW5_9ACTN|nr:hypothetical protein [Actinospica durhamensis]MBR7833475.1 hypothetical protein [Actinospica durhamensis]